MPKTSIDISIIIVNYNGDKYLLPCLESVFKSVTQYDYEIILVDNASTDQSISSISSLLDRLVLIQNTQNMGFPVANNQGIANANGRFVFLLNTDTVISADTLEILTNYAKAHPEAGAISPRLRNRDNTIQIPGNPLIKSPYLKNTPTSVSFISGAAFFTTMDIMKTIGGLDEAFFFYNDDIDLCIRIKKIGMEVIQLPNGDVLHYGGGSSHFDFKRLNYEGMRGGLYMVRKHRSNLAFQCYRIVLLVFATVMAIACGVLFQSKTGATFVKLIKAILKNELENIPPNQN